MKGAMEMRRSYISVLSAVCLSIALSGCASQKYNILRGTDLPNPPNRKIRITLKGFPGYVKTELSKEKVMAYRDLRRPDKVTKDFFPLRERENPFQVVNIDENPELIIEGRTSTDRLPGTSRTRALGLKTDRKITFFLTVRDPETNRVVFSDRIEKVFGPEESEDDKLISYVFLAFMLETSPF